MCEEEQKGWLNSDLNWEVSSATQTTKQGSLGEEDWLSFSASHSLQLWFGSPNTASCSPAPYCSQKSFSF